MASAFAEAYAFVLLPPSFYYGGQAGGRVGAHGGNGEIGLALGAAGIGRAAITLLVHVEPVRAARRQSAPRSLSQPRGDHRCDGA